MTERGSSLAEAGSRRNRQAGFISFPAQAGAIWSGKSACDAQDRIRRNGRRRVSPPAAGAIAQALPVDLLQSLPVPRFGYRPLDRTPNRKSGSPNARARRTAAWQCAQGCSPVGGRSSAPRGGVVVVPVADRGPVRRRAGHRGTPGGALPGSRNAAAARPGNLSPQAATRSIRSDACSGVRSRRSCRAQAIVRTPPSTVAIPRRSWRTSLCRGNGPGR